MPNETRWFTRSVDRRSVLRGGIVAGAGLASAALIGCSASGTPKAPAGAGGAALATPAAASGKPKSGGALRYAETKNPDILDPVRSGGGLPTQSQLIYSRLFEFEYGEGKPASGKIRGDLVEKWEQPDPLTMILRLNQAAKFDDQAPLNGRSVNSQDVVESWKRWAKSDTYRTRLANSANPDAPIESMEAVDASTVRVKMKFVDATALSNLAGGFWIQPAEGVLEKFDLAKEPRGTGPFILESYKPSVGFEFKRNPKWFRGGGERPYVEKLSVPIIPEQAQLDVQFRSKSLQFGAVSQTNIVQFAKELKGTEVSVGAHDGRSPILVFSYSPGQPWHDVRLRRAVSMAIDRDKIADLLFDPKQYEPLGAKLTTRWNAPISGGYGPYWLDPKDPKFGPAGAYLKNDIAEAKKLLAAAGYGSGKTFEFDNVYPGIQWDTNWPQRVEILQAMVQEAGMKMNAVSVDYVTEYTPKYMRAKAQFQGKVAQPAVHFMPGGAGSDALGFYLQFLSSNGSSSMVGKQYPELDAMMRKQQAVTNFDERVAGIHEMNKWTMDNMVVWPVGPFVEVTDLVWKNVRGPQLLRPWVSAKVTQDLFPYYYIDDQA